MFLKIVLMMLFTIPIYAEENLEPFPTWYPLIAIALMLIAKIVIGKKIKDRVEKEIEEENKKEIQK